MQISSTQKQQLLALKNKIERIYPLQAYTVIEREKYCQINEDANAICGFISIINENGDDDEKMLDEIKELLAERWERIKNDTSLRYDTAFYIPLNQLIVNLCDILKPSTGLSKYQLMIPELEQVESFIMMDHVDEYHLHELIFCGSAPNNSYLVLGTCFTTALDNGDTFFKLYHNNIDSRPELDAIALELIQNRDPWSGSFITATKKLPIVLADPDVKKGLAILDKLEELRTYLLTADVDHEGEEEDAGSEAYDGIYNFHIYLGSLSEQDKTQIMSLRHNNEYQRIKVFRTLWDEITYNDENNDDIKDDQQPLDPVRRCLYLKGQNLDEIITANKVTLLGPQAAELIETVKSFLSNFTDGNNHITNLINGFIENNDQLIRETVETLQTSLTEQNCFLIEVALRSCILYCQFHLLVELLELLNFNIQFFTPRLLKSLVNLVPTIYIKKILPSIDINLPTIDRFNFLYYCVYTKRTDIVQLLCQQHSNLAYHTITTESNQPPRRLNNILDYAVYLGCEKSVDALIHSITRPDWNFFNNLINEQILEQNPGLLLTVINFVRTHRACFKRHAYLAPGNQSFIDYSEPLSSSVSGLYDHFEDCIHTNDLTRFSAFASFCNINSLNISIIKSIEANNINMLTHILKGNFYREPPDYLRFHHDHSAGRDMLSAVSAALNIPKLGFLKQITANIIANTDNYNEYDIVPDKFIAELNEHEVIDHPDVQEILSTTIGRQIIILKPYEDTEIYGESFDVSADNPPVFLFTYLESYYPLQITNMANLDDIISSCKDNPNLSIINRVINSNAEYEKKSAMICAIRKLRGQFALVKCLLDNNVDPNEPVRMSYSDSGPFIFYPIIEAAKRNLRDVVELLIKNNANPDVTDHYNKTFHDYLAELPDPDGEAFNLNVAEEPLLTCSPLNKNHC